MRLSRLAALAGSLACAARFSFAQHIHADSAKGPSWSWSFDWRATGLYVNEATRRGAREFALADWEQVWVQRRIGAASLGFGAQTSIAPFILGGDGTPQLLQTGGTYRHAWLHDRMHPPPGVMLIGGQFVAPRFVLQALAVGAPPLGPEPYHHRASAQWDVFAPLGHHWQDATHTSFGVVNAAMGAGPLWLEAGAFNARENDETHPVVDYRGARLDSYAARITLGLSSASLAAWTGFLNEPHRLDPTTRMHRMGASLRLNPDIGTPGWTTLIVWGMNVHHHGAGSHLLLHAEPGASPHHESRSALVESTAEVKYGWHLFGRAEFVEKNGEELGFLGGDLTTIYPIKGVSVGAAHEMFGRVPGAAITFGVRASMELVPEDLRATYGTRTPAGAAVFIRLRSFRPSMVGDVKMTDRF